MKTKKSPALFAALTKIVISSDLPRNEKKTERLRDIVHKLRYEERVPTLRLLDILESTLMIEVSYDYAGFEVTDTTQAKRLVDNYMYSFRVISGI